MGFSIIGKDNGPLYLRDNFLASFNSKDDINCINSRRDHDILNGMDKNLNKKCSIDNQTLIHAALDYFNEKLTKKKFRIKSRKSTLLEAIDTMWLGSLCCLDDMRVYGMMFLYVKVSFLLNLFRK